MTMNRTRTIQGRIVEHKHIEQIRSMLATHPQWHRTQLSRALCKKWKWFADNGQMKDMAARSLLLKLENRGFITLPPRRCSANNDKRYRKPLVVSICEDLIAEPLLTLKPIDIRLVMEKEQVHLFQGLLQNYHYLGYTGPVGENLKYLILDNKERPLGCLLFGAAAWKVGCRDEFIGWQAKTRERHLFKIANNMRFLLLPHVKVPCLASFVLGKVARRISADWQTRYGHHIVLLETYVQANRFQGISYRAANWIHIGQTAGRTRNDRYSTISVPTKSVFVYPLTHHFKTVLTEKKGEAHGTC